MRTCLSLLFLLFFTLTAHSQSNYLKVTAKKGDGILTLLRRHGLSPAASLKAFIQLNKENLGKGNSLYAGKTYLLPSPAPEASDKAPETTAGAAAKAMATPGKLEVPLFGEKYARVDVVDQQLQGAIYYLLAGHAGPDPGAVGKYGPYALAEDEYAYDVTARLARTLMEHGATVYMIIQDPDDGIRDENILKMDKDEITYPTNKPVSYGQRERLRQRTNAVNKLYAAHKGAYQRMLCIHVDSRSKSQNIDVFFYHHENSPAGQELAESIHQTFTSKYNRHQPNRDYSGTVSQRSSLYVVKYSDPPTVFIELGNIRNDLDQRRFVIANNRQALANWITEGIIADFKASTEK
ncbi:N-acetylmuramoyl-L-alanine amidase [Pontibacter sp. 172403-2]|uniref:N-acetylmuramoyl-L-alanine amidase family protein n=1 Tax=Pontibacter rufus TaxID=2791028 RepID=UPI0018AF8A22|nr:N-acetylmuramoyl-L-alanine amidase [Pontibacter sp. 172403-2]MBF9255591.1 N-acetylmuramoyl-L-alanine amidase [Pontibacter sp. 172403-2]